MGCQIHEKFRSYFSIRTGGITLGCLGIILGIVGIIRSSIEDLDIIVDLLKYGLSLTTTTSVITIVVAVVYLYGIFSKRAWFMLPAIVWIVFGVSVETGFWGITIMNSISKLFHLRIGESIKAIMFILFMLALLVLQWYLIVISLLLFMKIKDPNSFANQSVAYHTTGSQQTNQNHEDADA